MLIYSYAQHGLEPKMKSKPTPNVSHNVQKLAKEIWAEMATRKIVKVSLIYDVSVIFTCHLSHVQTLVIRKIRVYASSLKVLHIWECSNGLPSKGSLALRSAFYLFHVATYW